MPTTSKSVSRRCACGAHALPPRAVNDPPGMAPTLCIDGVQHSPIACQRYEPSK